MRICVLGGTRFIGRAVVEHLAERHDVLIVHRGESEPDDLVEVAHLHTERAALGDPDVARALDDFGPDAVVDTMALTGADADRVLGALPAAGRLVVLSSMDVYRAYGSLHAGTVTDAVPLDEQSPVRPERYPYRGQVPGMDDYDKLDVEERWLERGATVVRLPMVTGPRDYQRRQEFVLRRLRHGRTEIPVGRANGLFTHGDVDDMARGVAAIVEADEVVAGEVFNLGEVRTPTMRLRAEWIVTAAGTSATLVEVPDEVLPPDLGITAHVAQHLLVSSAKASERLGWQPSQPAAALARTVAWHLEHPPEPDDDDFSADDAALTAVS